MASEFAVMQFESKLDRALEQVRLVLDAAKAPSFPSGVHHRYQDKYLLAESLTNAALASQLNCLALLGLGHAEVARLREWAGTSAVSLRFCSDERCSFLREEKRDVENVTRQVSEQSIGGIVRASLASKVVTTVTKYFWKLECSYQLMAVRGVGQEEADGIMILHRVGVNDFSTTTEGSPFPEARVPAIVAEVNTSWLFRQLSGEAGLPGFRVKRACPDCHTPRRNPDVDEAVKHFEQFSSWAEQVSSYLFRILRMQPEAAEKFDFDAVRADSLFVPVLPLLEETQHDNVVAIAGEAGAADAGSTAAEADCSTGAAATALAQLSAAGEPADSLVMTIADTNRLLEEELRGLREKRAELAKVFPGGDVVASAAEAALSVTLAHCVNVCQQWEEAMDYIEGMLRQQLVAAIGKQVTPADFAEYMRFHNRKLFAEAYAPVPFCFAVRRSERHSPEGTVSIEECGRDSNIAAPIFTLVARSDRPHTMRFPLGASSQVSFGGDRYLHGWLSHRFSGSGASASLVSRSRQFSAMLVLVGRIASVDTFEPRYAAIVQNKDELTIPLDLSTIPTREEFKDAIESLSPEQQAFAKAFRAMQLESTLLGVLVIQVKPQLEKVLNLPPDSLTKEIKLTQELVRLFSEYQIPSDLLSFDGRDGDTGSEILGSSASEQVEAVKEHVKALNEMIEEAKKAELEERRMEVRYEEAAVEEIMPLECAAGRMKSIKKGGRQETAVLQNRRLSTQQQAVPKIAQASAAVVPAPPAGHAQEPPQPQQPLWREAEPANASEQEAALRDYTKVPREMDERFERLDTDGAVHPTTIKPSTVWRKRAQKSLLTSPATETLYSDDLKKETDKVFDLLDALTKSGALTVDHASLHTVVAATHCFDKSITETVVQDNINPIDKVERSTLIMASTVHQQPAAALVNEAQYQRVTTACPMLFDGHME